MHRSLAVHVPLCLSKVSTVVDYLEARPKAASALHAAITSGAISLGPWYTAPDTYLASGEALVRNLLLARRHAHRLGLVRHMDPLAYLADSFGHNSQLPQLYTQFGLWGAVLARGLSPELGSEVLWAGADDSTVLTLHLKHWYGASRAGRRRRGRG